MNSDRVEHESEVWNMKKIICIALCFVMILFSSCDVGVRARSKKQIASQMAEKYGFLYDIENGKAGVKDVDGRTVVKPKYDYVGWLSEGFVEVELNDKWGFVDESGNEVIPCKYDYAEFFLMVLQRFV